MHQLENKTIEEKNEEHQLEKVLPQVQTPTNEDKVSSPNPAVVAANATSPSTVRTSMEAPVGTPTGTPTGTPNEF